MKDVALKMLERAKALLESGEVARVVGWKKGDFCYDPSPAVFESVEELENEDIVPYKKLVADGIDAVMIGHVIVDSIDEVYFDEYGNMTGRYYYSGTDTYHESYRFYNTNSGDVVSESAISSQITYTDSSKTQIAEEKYSYRQYSTDYSEVISKGSYEEEARRIKENSTLFFQKR